MATGARDEYHGYPVLAYLRVAGTPSGNFISPSWVWTIRAENKGEAQTDQTLSDSMTITQVSRASLEYLEWPWAPAFAGSEQD